ncbi:transcriptional regulator [Actinoalloteichus sp. GBA129-24]|uniref:transcriptional regulator n=1 Tax=Actinoalloteichus sp. GBA129-24 TaxID=1612551 RepID=UPI0009506AB5|nr:transcriptional regulator [Actinoalloteichus sp. GBA129-24]APU23541.1 hypothetical protein UA75_27850 [Actinoalloteichus sp. GBA129-24]
MDRRGFLTATSAASLSMLGLTDSDAVTRQLSRATGSVRVGAGEVTAIRTMTTTLGDAAAELGGGHARHLAVRYLVEDVGPWLAGRYTDRVGRELRAATSELTHLAGWMARDAGADDLAARYYDHSYRLATEVGAGAEELAATALRGLAERATDAGDIPTALAVAEACAQRGRDLANPKARAYYVTTHARAAAAAGDRITASRLLSAAQAAIETAPTTPGRSWASHYSHGRWAHDAGMILARLGDHRAAAEHLHLALDIHGLDRRRSRALVLADLGGIQLAQGAVDAALATWTEFLDVADGVRSVRITDSIGAIGTRLPATAGAEELRERIAGESGLPG